MTALVMVLSLMAAAFSGLCFGKVAIDQVPYQGNHDALTTYAVMLTPVFGFVAVWYFAVVTVT